MAFGGRSKRGLKEGNTLSNHFIPTLLAAIALNVVFLIQKFTRPIIEKYKIYPFLKTSISCSCSMSNIRQYIYNVIKQYQIDVKKYVSSSSDVKCKKSNGKIEHITRKGIFQYLCMNGELTKEKVDKS